MLLLSLACVSRLTYFAACLAPLRDKRGKLVRFILNLFSPVKITVGNVITMNDRISDGNSRKASVRDRRYAIRYPFAADAEVLDLESGTRSEGVTSDLSLGGCFVCTSKPLAVKSRTRVTLRRKNESVEALAMVRIVKPRIGMGLEFIDLEPNFVAILRRWLEHLRRDR